jgi:hypothetical protein
MYVTGTDYCPGFASSLRTNSFVLLALVLVVHWFLKLI